MDKENTMLIVQCKDCRKEVASESGSCGCPNMVMVKGDTVTALDLSRVIMIRSNNNTTKAGLTSQDLQWQEERRKRKVRKLDFEVR